MTKRKKERTALAEKLSLQIILLLRERSHLRTTDTAFSFFKTSENWYVVFGSEKKRSKWNTGAKNLPKLAEIFISFQKSSKNTNNTHRGKTVGNYMKTSEIIATKFCLDKETEICNTI